MPAKYEHEASTGMGYSALPTQTNEYVISAQRNDHSPPISRDGEIGQAYSTEPSEPSHNLAQSRSADSDKIAVHSSSQNNSMSNTGRRRSPAGDRGRSDLSPQEEVGYPHTVPRRKESLPQNRVHRRDGSNVDGTSNQRVVDLITNSAGSNTRNQTGANLPSQQTGGDLSTEIDQALASLSMEEREAQQQSHGGIQHGHDASEHLRLPQGFNVGHTETTTIDTEWRPAVTHEKIHNHRTEIIQEAITRDIHIHHYYTYVQPIKVVEVLPAKHYRYDAATGLKTEIPAPRGWVMPTNLQPHTPDMSSLSGYTRHYLVNEQYPTGIAEDPPSDEHRQQHQSYVAGQSARNTQTGRTKTNRYSAGQV